MHAYRVPESVGFNDPLRKTTMSTSVRQIRACSRTPLLRPLAAAAMTFAMAQAAHAEAPMLKNQPGFYRTMIGDIEVTALSDGTNHLPAGKMLKGISKEDMDKRLQAAFVTDPVETSVNAFLVNTGKKLILIDTGAGGVLDADSGHLLTSLKAAGYRPDQVDEVYLTHLHPDHEAGLTHKGKRVFPKAIVRADKKDADYWLNPANKAKASAINQEFFEVAEKSLKPYIAAGKFRPFEGDGELQPGVSSVANYGHTPGHNAYLVSSKGQRLLIVGDMIHVAAVQFPQPDVTIGFDTDEQEAMGDRRKAFDAVADARELIAGAHLSFPGIGHIVKDGSGYRWVPINYALVR